MIDYDLVRLLRAQFPRLLGSSERDGQVQVRISEDHPKARALVAAFNYLATNPGKDGIAVFVEMLRDVVRDKIGFDRECRRIGVVRPFNAELPGLPFLAEPYVRHLDIEK